MRVVSLISLSGLLLSGCRNTDLSVLTLCLATLPNLWVNSSSFLVASLGYSIYSIMSSAVTVLLLLFPSINGENDKEDVIHIYVYTYNGILLSLKKE